MSIPRSILITIVVLLALAVPQARAGIADSPLPVLTPGAKTLHLYSVPSVIRGGGLETFFGCTSTDTATMQVGVELFAAPGGGAINDAVASSLSVAPGATVLFGTNSAAWVVVDSLVSASSKGSARILATSTKLTCTAFVADAINVPPTTSWQLTIIAKLKQKAAN